MEETKIYLNTWKAYNEGSIGYGWMTADEAECFIAEDPERDGGEWFIADIDNYIGVDFGNLDYCNVDDVIKTIQTLEAMNEYERKCVAAIMECYNMDVEQAIDDKDSHIFYADHDAYYESCDEMVEEEINNSNSILARFFNYDAYHRECDFDAYEASNGIVVVG